MLKLLREFYKFFTGIVEKRDMIRDLMVNDLKARFAGSGLGIMWAFIQPVVTIAVFWVVFESGFKTPPAGDFPFFLYLCTGIIPWTFFSDAVSTSASSVLEKSFLVKKVVFQVSVLPIVKLLAALVIHLFFIALLFIIFPIFGFYPSVYWLQLGYYLLFSLVLLTGISWVTSASILFFRDIGQIISIVLQLMFWATPIFWSLNIVPARYKWIFQLNPVYYLVEGYRDSFLYKVWFWEHPLLSLYACSVAVAMFVFGAYFFKKLRPHFADVL
jgi:lipopolysaccharide transport system permease protein/teichoic acid transport system permease protein